MTVVFGDGIFKQVFPLPVLVGISCGRMPPKSDCCNKQHVHKEVFQFLVWLWQEREVSRAQQSMTEPFMINDRSLLASE